MLKMRTGLLLRVSMRVGSGYAYFSVRYVGSTSVDMNGMFYSFGDSNYNTYAVCPVVSLKSNIQLTRNTGETEWKIELAQN